MVTHFFSPDEEYKLNIVGENAVAGIFELFAPFPTKAAWETLSQCTCYLFTRQQAEAELPGALLANLLEQNALVAAFMVERFTLGAGKRNDIRLARFLLHYVQNSQAREGREDGTITIAPHITQEISSQLLAMHPVTFNKHLAAFRRIGIIGKSKQSSLEILDAERLGKYAAGDMPPLM